MKIRFAPLSVPLRRRLQTAAVLQWIFSFLGLAQCCLATFILLSFSSWWTLAFLYAGWLWLDRDTPNRGGRRCPWIRRWSVWEHFRDYFPIKLVKTVDLDPGKNYIFGFHPHGVLATGAFCNFCTESTGFSGLFPGLKSHLLMLPFWFRVPIFRDYIMCGGLVSSSKSSLSYLLSRPQGGNVAVIAVGAAPEALDARPGALTLQSSPGPRLFIWRKRALRSDSEPKRISSEDAPGAAAKHYGNSAALDQRQRSLPVQLRSVAAQEGDTHSCWEAHPGPDQSRPERRGHRRSSSSLPGTTGRTV
ncbi:2-acylglycerol O-acyltransferase 2-B isoform X2 [Syngnathoides biaculeatus]|uniref:2-acylglycerol O-acyltransferase 2-B isoform X2 n=1 Tax=Syngnathoides biaculeatus TaxID=300417 RepID=UPI002ADD5523|nr:2-acylglycerol O-acyltransferase 2-B isoform X2 [Syngnathoides biaculeatus]